MRTLIRLEGERRANIPLDFRGGFIGFFKDIFGNYYKRRCPKEYVFSVYFGKDAMIVKKHIENVRFINLRVSSENDDLIEYIMNRVAYLSENGKAFVFGDTRFYAFSIEIMPETISDSFYTLSPVVVSKEKDYLTPFDEGFKEALIDSIKTRFTTLKGYEPDLRGFTFYPKSIKTELILHYKGYIKAFRGDFDIKASAEVLSFIYKNGLGYRTAQGFGFLECR